MTQNPRILAGSFRSGRSEHSFVGVCLLRAQPHRAALLVGTRLSGLDIRHPSREGAR
jgi:hypothetical protein